VTTSDTLPPGTTFVAADAPEGCTVNEQEGITVVSCTIGALAPGASGSSTLTLLTDPTATTLSNTGSGGSGATDPAPADNSDTVSVPLLAPPQLVIAKTGPSSVVAGGVATYELAYANEGGADAEDVVVTDVLPAGMSLVAAPGCTLEPERLVRCPIGAVAAGGSGVVAVDVQVDPDLASGTVLKNLGQVSAFGLAPAGGAESAHETTVEGRAIVPDSPTTPPADPPATDPSGGSLPITGTDLAAAIGAAAVLCAAGLGLRRAGSRRKDKHFPIPH
jgi:uncharacterized repeat protein (TIGR01451 family)